MKNKLHMTPLLWGSILEYYDFSVYGFMAPFIAPLFFPHESRLVSLIITYAAFAISFIMRPIGGIFFGTIGDKYGRKNALVFSMLLMACSSLVIGLLPTYDKIGIVAPLILISCRFVQSFCIAGEYWGCILLSLEENKWHRSAFVASWITSAGVLGWFFGSAISSISMNINFPIQSWRVPFLLGSLVAIAGYYIRRTLPESQKIKKVTQVGYKQFIRKKSFMLKSLSVVVIAGLNGSLFYSLLIFPNAYLTDIIGMNRSKVLYCTTLGIAFYMLFLPLLGWLSGRFTSLKVMRYSIYGSFFFALPSYYLLSTGNFTCVIIAEIGATFIMAGMMASSVPLVSCLFPSQVRYRSVSFNYNVGNCLLGGSTPLISTFLISATNLVISPAFHIMLCALLSLIGWIIINNNVDKKIDRSCSQDCDF